MYQISYNNQVFSYNTIDETITQLSNFHTKFKDNLKQVMIMLQWDNPNFSLLCGIGHPTNNLLLFIEAKDIRDDHKLVLNPLEDIHSKNNIYFEQPHIPFICAPYNLIPLNTALEEIHYMLSHNSPSNTLKWYSY